MNYKCRVQVSFYYYFFNFYNLNILKVKIVKNLYNNIIICYYYYILLYYYYISKLLFKFVITVSDDLSLL